jgi:hypothetical protein
MELTVPVLVKKFLLLLSKPKFYYHINALKPKDSRRVEVKRKHLEGKRKALYIWGGGEKKEHLVRRYPGNARSSF